MFCVEDVDMAKTGESSQQHRASRSFDGAHAGDGNRKSSQNLGEAVA